VRPLGNGTWEMRLTGRDGIGRAIYSAVAGRRLVVLCVCKENAKDPAQGDKPGTQAPEGVRFVTKPLQRTKRKMLANRQVREAYEALSDEFDLARELIAARARAGLTQAEVAERMGTTQSVVARLESGAQMPSVNTLLKFAKATRSRPIIKLLAA
jgi:ribosome-binding protein aMBF1 (putative translation factor)